MFKLLPNFFLIILFIFITSQINLAQEKQNFKQPTSIIFGEPSYTKFNINNISTFIYNDGRMDVNRNRCGFEYPKRSNLFTVYLSGFYWGGIADGELITNGSIFPSGILPGKILSDGSAEDPDNPNVRIYRVRPDYKDCDLSGERDDEDKTEEEIKAQYSKDWNEWPAADGAPFSDVDGDGFYNPDVDVPGIEGANQTIWFVTNSLDEDAAYSFYGSKPFGIELQVTVWGYKNFDPLKNVYFKMYKIINKDHRRLDSMFVALFADADIGNVWEDYIGCDTLLNLGYTYNALPSDRSYGNNPPAVGTLLLQGPIVEGEPADTAFNYGIAIPGMKNLKMTSFNPYYRYYNESSWGDYIEPNSLYLYFILNGFIPTTGNEYPVPEWLGGGTTKFPLSGDPVTGEGYIDGIFEEASDRRYMQNSGPFSLEPGDTQVVVYAQFAAGANPGQSNLEAITELKKNADEIIGLYPYLFDTFKIIDAPTLTAASFDNQILLEWGEDQKKTDEIESAEFAGYKFQGYNIYQFPLSDKYSQDTLLIATFDAKDGLMYYFDDHSYEGSGTQIPETIQFGSDSGLERYLLIERDAIAQTNLLSDSDYKFGVTAFAYYPEASRGYHLYNNGISEVNIKVASNNPGVRYNSEFGEMLNVTHTDGNSNGYAEVTIIDPTIQTGNDYEITFSDNGQLVWDLTNVSKDSLLLSGQTNLNGGDQYYITDGFVVKVFDDAENPLTVIDKFSFTAPTVTYDEETAILDTEEINVFPNPYYGQHNTELNYYESFVTFNHLPERAVIKIFNLAGQHVRSLEKNDNSQYLRWDLMNDHQFLVGSGIYIAYIELPVLGKVKILKLAVIQQNKIPSWY